MRSPRGLSGLNGGSQQTSSQFIDRVWLLFPLRRVCQLLQVRSHLLGGATGGHHVGAAQGKEAVSAVLGAQTRPGPPRGRPSSWRVTSRSPTLIGGNVPRQEQRVDFDSVVMNLPELCSWLFRQLRDTPCHPRVPWLRQCYHRAGGNGLEAPPVRLSAAKWGERERKREREREREGGRTLLCSGCRIKARGSRAVSNWLQVKLVLSKQVNCRLFEETNSVYL